MLTCLLTALLAWLLHRLCLHHPRRWRRPLPVAALAAAVALLAWRAAGRGGLGAVDFFIALTLTMLWLVLVPLASTWWRSRAAAHGA